MFIHGPFDFATVNDRKTQDHILKIDWGVLDRESAHVSNTLPPFWAHVSSNCVAYIDTAYHSKHTSSSFEDRLVKNKDNVHLNPTVVAYILHSWIVAPQPLHSYVYLS